MSRRNRCLKNKCKPNIMYIPAKIKPNKKVAIYCRVSTTHDSQEESLEAQIKGLEQIVKNNPKWSLFKVYTDKDSGGNTFRSGFQSMIFDCYENFIDIVLVKSISRLARNTVDLLETVNKLRSMGIEMIFDQENIRTSEVDNDVLVATLTAIAQAEVVRKIFNLYLSGYSIGLIINELECVNIKTSRGKDKWSKRAIQTILTNEKYIGNVVLGKTYTGTFPNNNQQINRGAQEKYLMETAISNTLLSMNLNPEFVAEYMHLLGEVEFVQNSSRQSASWVTKAGIECAFYVGNEYNGIAKMFCDTIGVAANRTIVNCSGANKEGFYPYKAMINALYEVTGKQAYKYRAFELLVTPCQNFCLSRNI